LKLPQIKKSQSFATGLLKYKMSKSIKISSKKNQKKICESVEKKKENEATLRSAKPRTIRLSLLTLIRRLKSKNELIKHFLITNCLY
jgi:hypothetical protein